MVTTPPLAACIATKLQRYRRDNITVINNINIIINIILLLY